MAIPHATAKRGGVSLAHAVPIITDPPGLYNPEIDAPYPNVAVSADTVVAVKGSFRGLEDVRYVTVHKAGWSPIPSPFFLLRAGQPLPANTTYACASPATYQDSNYDLQTVAANVYRNAHYVGGQPYIIVEPFATNLASYSENWAAGVWNYGGASQTNGGASVSHIAHPLSRVYQAITTLTGTQTVTLSAWFAAADVGKPVRFSVWGSALDGLSSGLSSDMVVPASRLLRWTITGADISMFGLTNGSDGAARIITPRIQIEPTKYGTSYIMTTSSSASRSQGTLVANPSPTGATISPISMYYDGLEYGTAYMPQAAERLWQFGGNGNFTVLAGCAGEGHYGATVNDGSWHSRYDNPQTTFALGDRIEHRVVLRSNTFDMGLSKNGGAEVLASVGSTALSGSAPFTLQTNILNINKLGADGGCQLIRGIVGIAAELSRDTLRGYIV